MLRMGQTVGAAAAMVGPPYRAVTFPAAWRIFLRYLIMRFDGATKEKIISWGNFLNYGITWDDAEQVFKRLSDDQAITSKIAELFRVHAQLEEMVAALKK